MPQDIHIIKLHVTNYDIAGWKEKGLGHCRIDWHLISMHLIMFYHKGLFVAEAYSFRAHVLKRWPLVETCLFLRDVPDEAYGHHAD